MDQACVIDDLRAKRRRVDQLCQIANAADFRELPIALEMLAQRHTVADAPVGDHAIQNREDFLVGPRIEIARRQDVRDALMRVVVEQNRAQHSHLRRHVVRGFRGVSRGGLQVADVFHGPLLAQPIF